MGLAHATFFLLVELCLRKALAQQTSHSLMMAERILSACFGLFLPKRYPPAPVRRAVITTTTAVRFQVAVVTGAIRLGCSASDSSRCIRKENYYHSTISVRRQA